MSVEYEAKFLNIPLDEIKRKLIACGAKQVHPPIKFHRAVFKLCKPGIKGYVRVRDEGHQITLTAKIYKNEKFPEEYEITIKEGFQTGINFLLSLGLTQKAFQESFREKWSHPLAHEITFDILPGLPVYMEVDCTSEAKLNDLVKILDLDMKMQRFGAFDRTYLEYYGIPRETINDKTKSLSFSGIKKEIKPTKNKELFEKMIELHGKLDKYYQSEKMDKFFAEYAKIDITIKGGQKQAKIAKNNKKVKLTKKIKLTKRK